MLTKAVDRDTLVRHMNALGMECREGRHPCTPEYNGCVEGAKEEEAEAAEDEPGDEEKPKTTKGMQAARRRQSPANNAGKQQHHP